MAPAARVFPAQPLQALGTILSLTALLWAVEFYDQLTGERLDQDGIVPRSVDGLDGIVWAPLLHGGWAHLVANTLPFLVFGFLVLARGMLIADGTAESIRDNPEVQQVYLGTGKTYAEAAR